MMCKNILIYASRQWKLISWSWTTIILLCTQWPPSFDVNCAPLFGIAGSALPINVTSFDSTWVQYHLKWYHLLLRRHRNSIFEYNYTNEDQHLNTQNLSPLCWISAPQHHDKHHHSSTLHPIIIEVWHQHHNHSQRYWDWCNWRRTLRFHVGHVRPKSPVTSTLQQKCQC